MRQRHINGFEQWYDDADDLQSYDMQKHVSQKVEARILAR